MNNQGIFNTRAGNTIFVVGIPLVAIISGFQVWLNPASLELVLTLNFWLLGYHHVIATFCRLSPTAEEAKRNHRFLIHLPLLVIGCVVLLYFSFGAIAITSLYLYWQWFHYTRQSEGIAKSFGLKSTEKEFVLGNFNRVLFYTTSLSYFLWMVTRYGGAFFGQAYWSPYLDEMVRDALLAIGSGAMIFWCVRASLLLRQQRLSIYYFAYIVSHFVIYTIAYVIIDDITYGWIVINIWHNAQYLGFVWLFNNRAYASKSEEKFSIIAYLSRSDRVFVYFLAFFAISALVYSLISFIIFHMSPTHVVPMMIIVYAAINFHHYIVDSKIWKLRKPEIRSKLA